MYTCLIGVTIARLRVGPSAPPPPPRCCAAPRDSLTFSGVTELIAFGAGLSPSASTECWELLELCGVPRSCSLPSGVPSCQPLHLFSTHKDMPAVSGFGVYKTLMYWFSVWTSVPISFEYMLRSGIAVSRESLFLSLWETSNLFRRVAAPFRVPAAGRGCSPPPTALGAVAGVQW